MPCCCVSRCNSRSETNNKAAGVTFHLFPRNGAKRKKWVRSIGREEWNPSNSTVVCSKHFEKSCFYKTKNGLVRLFDDAVPTKDIYKKGLTGSDETSSTQDNERRKRNRLPEDLPILQIPIVDEDDSPKTKQLASHVRRLLFVLKKQRKSIRILQHNLKEHESQIKNLEFPAMKLTDIYKLGYDKFQEDNDKDEDVPEQDRKSDPYWA